MAFGNGSAGGNSRKSMMSDINVTPMVDVMLVLLIIFMVAAPMMTQGLEVNLPKVDHQPPLQTEKQQTVITIDVAGQVSINEDVMPDNGYLAIRLKGIMEAQSSKTVYIRADQNVPYGRVAEVMSEVRAAGITNVGLVTEPLGRISPEAVAGAAAASRRVN